MLKSLISPIAVGGDVGGQVQGGGDQDGAAGGGVRRAEGRAGHGPQAAPRRLRDQDEAHRRPRGTVQKGEHVQLVCLQPNLYQTKAKAFGESSFFISNID